MILFARCRFRFYFITISLRLALLLISFSVSIHFVTIPFMCEPNYILSIPVDSFSFDFASSMRFQRIGRRLFPHVSGVTGIIRNPQITPRNVAGIQAGLLIAINGTILFQDHTLQTEYTIACGLLRKSRNSCFSSLRTDLFRFPRIQLLLPVFVASQISIYNSRVKILAFRIVHCVCVHFQSFVTESQGRSNSLCRFNRQIYILPH